jgi:hypothetical protein
MLRIRCLPVLLVLLLALSLLGWQPHVAQAQDSVYYVDNARDDSLTDRANQCNDSSPDTSNCSLRQAIEKATSDQSKSVIRFVIPATPDDEDPNTPPTTGYNGSTQRWTIRPNSALPPLANEGDTTIDGTKDSPVGTPRIVLDGTTASVNDPSDAVGIRIRSANNVVKKLAIVNFNGDSDVSGIGVLITGANVRGNQILGNYIGTLPQTSGTSSNDGAGIRIDGGANNNRIGVDTNGVTGIDQRNIISGNIGDGITLDRAENNFIQGNYVGVGLNPDFSTFPQGNRKNGIQIINSGNNTIGGTSEGLRNTIAANDVDGIKLTDSGTQNNTITGNFIGTNFDGAGVADFGNKSDGVEITNEARNNIVSGTPAVRSVISGNRGYGVLINGINTTGNRILGAFIGLDSGGGPRSNAFGGVRLQNGATRNFIGDSGVGQGNIISGNTNYGISVGSTTGAKTISNDVRSNIIGLNSAGTAAVANGKGGILIDDRSEFIRVGIGGQNIISGNTGPGVVISGTLSFSNRVVGNVIGLKRSAPGAPLTVKEPNTGDGVLVTGGARSTVVGGGNALEGNVIAGNGGDGVNVIGADTVSTTVRFNLIGVTKNDNQFVPDLGNTGNGVHVENGAQQVRILDNSISRNGGKGISLAGTTIGGGENSFPNHDIDPPGGIKLNQARQLSGRVVVTAGLPSACNKCLIQVFAADSVAKDEEGRDKIFETREIAANGAFTFTVPVFPMQLALTATDDKGNTSEFSVFTPNFLGLRILPENGFQQNVSPGQVITYTHTVSNASNIDFTDLKLTTKSSLGWTSVISPNGSFALAAGRERSVTLRLTVPSGDKPNARAGIIDTSVLTVTATNLVTATDSVTDTSTVLEQFVLKIDPLTREGNGIPESTVAYPHKLTNVGNITGTVSLAAVTDLGWTTTVTETNITLGPGKSSDAVVSVTIPRDTATGTKARTNLTITPTSPAQPAILVTDTTTVGLSRAAIIFPNREGEGAANQKISFAHTIQNLSNGKAKFRLTGFSSLGSTVRFVSTTPGITIANDGTFELEATEGRSVLNFFAEVTVSGQAKAGQVDTVTISLTDGGGVVIGGVLDTIRIVRSESIVYLPVVRR